MGSHVENFIGFKHNCPFSSALLCQNWSKPLRFFRRFDCFSSVFKRKNRRFSSVLYVRSVGFVDFKRKKRSIIVGFKRTKGQFSSVSNVLKIGFWQKLADIVSEVSQVELRKPTFEIFQYGISFTLLFFHSGLGIGSGGVL